MGDWLGGLEAVIGTDLVDCSINGAAKFAVEDHNREMNTELEFVGIEKAATVGGSGCMYYLILKAKDDGKIRLYQTAVCAAPWECNFIKSIGLEYIRDVEEGEEDDQAWSSTPPPVTFEPDDVAAAEFAVQIHNSKKHTQFRFGGILEVDYKFETKTHTRYSLRLYAYDHIHTTTKMFFSASVVKHTHIVGGDDFMESLGLAYICQHQKFPIPGPRRVLSIGKDWVSEDLLDKASATIHDAIKKHLEDVDTTALRLSQSTGGALPKELIPALSLHYDDLDHEEAYLSATALEYFVQSPLGSNNALLLLPPLEILCTIHDPPSRNRAVESLCKIGLAMNQKDICDSFIPLVKRLASGNNASQVSSCGLFHIAYKNATEDLREELRCLFGQLFRSNMPLVRRSAAKNLKDFISSVNDYHIGEDVLNNLHSPDLDASIQFVRIILQKMIPELNILFAERNDIFEDPNNTGLRYIVPLLKESDSALLLLPCLENLCDSKQHEIRDEAVKSLCDIGLAMNRENLCYSFIPLVKRLASGNDTSQVSSCGLFHIAYNRATENLKKELRWLFCQLCENEMPSVRMSAAMNLGNFASSMDHIHLNLDFIDMFLKLVADNDQVAVRMFALKTLAESMSQLEVQTKTCIKPVICECSQDVSLHVRVMASVILAIFYATEHPHPPRSDADAICRCVSDAMLSMLR